MRIDRTKVKRQMKKVGLERFADVAAAVGITRQSLSRWFAGDQFSSQSLAGLCRVLQCTPNDILIQDEATASPNEAKRSESALDPEIQQQLSELAARTGQDVNELLALFVRNERRRLDLLSQAAERPKQ